MKRLIELLQMPTPAQHAREMALLRALRNVTGLGGAPLHPEVEPFGRQAEAVAFFQTLVDDGQYRREQIGVFAQEIGNKGQRRFMVDTFAGFAKENTPEFNPLTFAGFPKSCAQQGHEATHLYEVILEDRPCWLYFDLEFSRITNPDLDPDVAMSAFRETLRTFCAEVLRRPLDEQRMIELESSTPQKFSKHVIVKALFAEVGDHHSESTSSSSSSSLDRTDNEAVDVSSPHVVADEQTPRCASTLCAQEASAVLQSGAREQTSSDVVAFENNAQAGLLVKEFVAFAQKQRDGRDSSARHLFVHAPPSESARIAEREVSIIDEGVYSRNRCFRLLFQTKFGKQAGLNLPRSHALAVFGKAEHPALQMLRTMVTFVPAGTSFFQHAVIPTGYCHAERPTCVARSTSGASSRTVRALESGLMQFLVEHWDGIRQANELKFSACPTFVQSTAEMGRFLVVTLSNNHFCFCKGASHASNHIYLVVNTDQCTFRQKCHDPECKHFASPPFDVPSYLLESKAEEDFWESVTLEQVVDTLKEEGTFGETLGPSSKRTRLSEEPQRVSKSQI